MGSADRGPRVVGIVVARTDSSRLPGKSMTTVSGRPLIGYSLERSKSVAGVHDLTLATTDRSVDDELAAFASALGVNVFRGDADDVAGRLLLCAEDLRADYLIRLNGDSPFIDPRLVERGLQRLGEGCDVITTVPGGTFPYGVSVEIVRVDALRAAHALMTAEEEEHVTQHFYRNRDRFSICELTSPAPELSAARMVVDTEDDLRAFERVVSLLGDSVLEADYQSVAPYYLDMGHVR
jgi:spore coat polysaccharide biosynthesis protein SpsF (cytidylyltransferase family)